MKGKKVAKNLLALAGGVLASAVLLGFILALTPVGLLYLLIAQTEIYDAAPDSLMFINQSSVPVHSVTMNDVVISNGLLEMGDDVTVEWDVWPGTVTACDEEGELARLYLSEAPNQDLVRDCWYVIAQDGPEGLILTQSHVWPLDDRVESMGERVGLDISAGVVEMYYARGRGINGDGSDYMNLLFTGEEGALLEQELAVAQGWHQLPMEGVVSKVFCGDPDCSDAAHAFRVPEVENGWYFFRDTYNAQHGTNDENQWNLDGYDSLPSNFTAAVYDSTANTLYVYDYDS